MIEDNKKDPVIEEEHVSEGETFLQEIAGEDKINKGVKPLKEKVIVRKSGYLKDILGE